MPKLIINRLIYTVETENEKYGADVPFHPGLNIIFGPNSVGKTSIVTGIIYGLGSEKGLGIFKSDQNPFKPEFYKSIEGKTVTKSYLILEISNGIKEYSIFRYIKGGKLI
ncbi:ATP-binding protein [Flavobacterium panacagri]|uniref:ATP-binding protein n=1 Tax=Flavobacterium panacagri TaxID=3034146 RepID=UPI0025A56515|nr:ATP-binding protein [Flavobacterium panacagri]